MILYQGQTTFLTESKKNVPFSTKVVVTFAKTIKLEKAAIYADNLFSSLELIRILMKLFGFRYIGTAHENRIGKPPLMSSENMNKNSVSKASLESCSNKEGILVAKWKDNKIVKLVTNDRGIEPFSKIQRYDKDTHQKISVDCPEVVKNYNSHMGGIDKNDML